MTAFTTSTIVNEDSFLNKVIDFLFQVTNQAERDEFDYLIYLQEQGISPSKVSGPIPDFYPPNGILTYEEWLDY